jgi:alkanesulfonate monooxygenase SsuD/methylene tetrahydromethanopterin reductase-like flavin-dependent oxidoreductase (luciferase family)
MSMKFDLFPLPTIPGTLEERAALRPIGRNNDRYQQMIDELRKIVILADEAGIDAFSTTEHHFHSEGFEASVAPLMLYTDFAARTKRIKFAPLGLVLPSWDPIRCAEELAILDHLTKGRVMAGFARGYQDRWTNILGQHYHVTGAPMDGSEVDQHNRAVFQEVFKIIKMAWTQDTIEYNSQYYSIPQPYEEGIRRWPAKEWTRKYGAGELDEEGVVRRVSVIPKPYQQPHPPLWQAFSVSESTIRWCARETITPWILIAHPESFVQLCRSYQEEAATVGRELRLGESIGAARSISIGKTYEEAFALGARTTGLGFHSYFGGFGFLEAFKYPGENDPNPAWAATQEGVYQRMIDHEYALCGTVDDIKRKLDSLARCHGNGELEWLGWGFPQGFLTWDEAQWQLETFATQILPEFKD